MDLQEIAVELVQKFFNKHKKLTIIVGILLLILGITALFE